MQKSLADEVFQLLRKKGPLDMTQISCELLVSMKKLQPAIELLSSEKVISRRPDFPDQSQELIPWGLG